MLAHRTETRSSAPSRAQRLARAGDLFYQTVRPYQKNNYLFKKHDNNYVFSTGYAQMRPYVDGYFLLSLVQSDCFVKVVLDNCTGTSYPAINANDLAEIEVVSPLDENETQKIGAIFHSIDSLITLHQRKLDKLINVKKSMLEKMFPKQGSTVPEIRFNGFTQAWEQRELNELALFNPKDELPQTFEYVDLEAVVGTEMLAHRTETRSSAPSRAQRLARAGDLFYQTVRPYQKNNYLFKKHDNNYVFSTGYAQMRPYVDGYFLLSLVQSDCFVKVVLDNCTGTSYPAINANDLAEIEVVSPLDENETQKIGAIFHSIDSLITLHQRKLDKLINVKKSMLEKMFPKQGSTVPEIRFNGFTQAWEQRKLGELPSSFEYGLNAASKSYDGINKYIRITDIDDETRTFLDTDLTSPDCDLSLSENYLLKDGDILFARTGASVGKTFIYKAFNGVVYYAGFLIRARLKENCSPQFVFYNTLTKEYEKFIRVTSQRSGQPGVNAHEYATFELRLPKYDEQCEIGKFFNNLDHLITLHQRKLEKLKNIKKSMLEKMFI